MRTGANKSMGEGRGIDNMAGAEETVLIPSACSLHHLLRVCVCVCVSVYRDVDKRMSSPQAKKVREEETQKHQQASDRQRALRQEIKRVVTEVSLSHTHTRTYTHIHAHAHTYTHTLLAPPAPPGLLSSKES